MVLHRLVPKKAEKAEVTKVMKKENVQTRAKKQTSRQSNAELAKPANEICRGVLKPAMSDSTRSQARLGGSRA